VSCWSLCPFETEAERTFWELARHTFPQVRIINQFQILEYRLDFYFPDHWICVEVDGGYHQRREFEDFERDTLLSEVGIDTVRFSNRDVVDDPQFVISTLAEALRSKQSKEPGISQQPNELLRRKASRRDKDN
jgi:ATP-dependent DNA helicase RecG